MTTVVAGNSQNVKPGSERFSRPMQCFSLHRWLRLRCSRAKGYFSYRIKWYFIETCSYCGFLIVRNESLYSITFLFLNCCSLYKCRTCSTNVNCKYLSCLSCLQTKYFLLGPKHQIVSSIKLWLSGNKTSKAQDFTTKGCKQIWIRF